VDAFYDEHTPDSERLALIEDFGVDFVLWGPEERSLGSWKPGVSDLLRGVIELENYQAFAVEME
jgi:hypothetical protein